MSNQATSCESIFKGSSKEEIQNTFNQKWIQTINNCIYTKNENSVEDSLHTSGNYDTIGSTVQEDCSANPKIGGAEHEQ